MRVNTLIIGAGRSGTTSISTYLEKHPEVCFSKIKEVHYFSIPDLYQRGENYYHSFFPHYNNQNIIASADTYLMMNYQAIKRIYNYNPDMKIVVMLRNPVDRAYSSYHYSVNYGYHKAYASFLQSVDAEKNIADEHDIVQRNNLGHFYAGLYHKHLSQWTKVFPQQQLYLFKTGDLKTNEPDFYKNLCHKLGINYVPKSQILDIEKRNAHAKPRLKNLEQFLLNRENPIRKIIRKTTPGFLKKWIIHSNIVDKIHDINRKKQAYELLNDHDREAAAGYFETDLHLLEKDFGLTL